MSYGAYLLILILHLTLLAQATDLLAGHAGRLGFGAIISAAVAGYSYAIVTTGLGIPPILGVVVGMLCAVLVAGALGGSLLRFGRDGYLLGTFAAQMALAEVLNNVAWAGGPLGLRNVPSPLQAQGPTAPLWGSLTVLVIGFVVAVGLLSAALGRRRALGLLYHWARDDALSSRAFGVSVDRLLLRASLIQGLIGGIAGIGFVIAQGYVSPETFGLPASLAVLTTVYLSGTGGHPLVMLLGSGLLVAVTEFLALGRLPPEYVGPFQQVVIGGILVTIIGLRRRGIAGPALAIGPAADHPS